MLDDMRMRKLTPRRRVRTSVRCAGSRYLGRAPDSATVEDLRNYQLHLVDTGTSPMSLNAAISGLKFFFDITLQRGELMARMQPVRLPQRRWCSAARSRAPDRRLQQSQTPDGAVARLRDRTASEQKWSRSKVSDVDSGRMTLQVEQSKGRKDRYAMLRPAAGAVARVVAGRPGAGQDARRRLAVPGPQPDRVAEPASAQSRCSGRRPGGRHRQAGVDARFATASRPTCSSRRSTSASSRRCSATKARHHGDLPQVATDLLREVVSPLEMLQPA